jgi:ribonucleoside-diphosphate reductase alpha chain
MAELHVDLVEFINALKAHYRDDERGTRHIPKNVEEWLGEDNKIGCDVWKRKYQYDGESFPEWLHRVSGGDINIAALIVDRKFLFGGRILSNRGVKDGSSMFNCHTLGAIPDSYEEIMKNLKDLGTTLKGQGGQGLSLSNLRPKGAPVGNRYQSDGIVPFMKMFNAVTEGTANGGSRRGALMMQLNAKHKEALEFIKIKQNSDQITAANISLEFDDDFMLAVEKYYSTGEVITLHQKKDYSGHLVEWDVVPIEVFKEFCKSSWDYAEPSALFMNRLQDYNMMEHDPGYLIEATNPCGRFLPHVKNPEITVKAKA